MIFVVEKSLISLCRVLRKSADAGTLHPADYRITVRVDVPDHENRGYRDGHISDEGLLRTVGVYCPVGKRVATASYSGDPRRLSTRRQRDMPKNKVRIDCQCPKNPRGFEIRDRFRVAH